MGLTDLPGAPVATHLSSSSLMPIILKPLFPCDSGGLRASWIIPDFGSWIHRHWTMLDTGRELSGVADGPGPAFCFHQTSWLQDSTS